MGEEVTTIEAPTLERVKYAGSLKYFRQAPAWAQESVKKAYYNLSKGIELPEYAWEQVNKAVRVVIDFNRRFEGAEAPIKPIKPKLNAKAQPRKRKATRAEIRSRRGEGDTKKGKRR